MFCSNCGNNCHDGSAFCTNCGASLHTQSTHSVSEQPAFQQPVYQQMYEQAMSPQENTSSKAPGFGLSIPGMILGILSAAFSCVFYLAPFFGIPGLILSIISLVKGRSVKKTNGMAVAGLICSIIGLLISVSIIALVVLGILEEESYAGGYYGYY